MIELTEMQLRIIIGSISFIIGFCLGYIVWHKNNERKLSSLQVSSIFVFFTYLLLTAYANVQYSDIVATAILSGIVGEFIGKAIKEKIGK